MLKLRLEIDIVSEWLKASKSPVNARKTKYVIFGTTHALRNMADMKLYYEW